VDKFNIKQQKRHQLFLIIVATMILFILNNIILGSVIPRMPGGSATGVTTMFIVTFVSLTIKKNWCIPMVYFIYGSIGLISHLLIDDWFYLFIILSITVISVIFNWVIHWYKYNITAYIIFFPVFVIILQFVNSGLLYIAKGQNLVMNLHATVLAIIFGYAGIMLAYISFKKLNDHKLIARFRY